MGSWFPRGLGQSRSVLRCWNRRDQPKASHPIPEKTRIPDLTGESWRILRQDFRGQSQMILGARKADRMEAAESLRQAHLQCRCPSRKADRLAMSLHQARLHQDPPSRRMEDQLEDRLVRRRARKKVGLRPRRRSAVRRLYMSASEISRGACR